MSDETATTSSPVKISWLIGIAIAFVLFSAIGGYSARMTQDTTDYDQDRAPQRYATLKKLQEDENKQLNPVDAQGKPTAIWIDQDKGVISIPIEEAMAKEVEDLKAKTAGPGPDINPPAPAPGPAAAPAAPAAKPAQATTPPAKPAPPAPPANKAAKTTSVSPTEPVFKTHSIKTAFWYREGEKWVKVGAIVMDPIPAKPKT